MDKRKSMKTSGSSLYIFGMCLTLFLPSTAVNAEIYKWVDEKGQTHYSEKKEDAGKSRAEEVRVLQSQESIRESPSTQYWQEQERQFKQRQLQKQIKETFPLPKNPRPVLLSGGRSGDSDTSKCNLARDVLSGAVRHRNGGPTDKYDREVAESDVKNFCR
jgi:hypothetical protein